jgi:ubiquinone/menaquinone biosynthesis C-methylase UbiE
MNTNNAEVNGWITDINSDDRIQLRQGDMANTHLPSNSVAVVNLSLVIHELPISATKQVIQEAYRILRPGGQLWISEMDFESPAYAAQRENALLFSLLRATEPYLDEYADGMPELRKYIAELFDVVKISAATGRHFALLAEKGNDGGHAVLEDYRFREDGSYAIEDTHLKPWESKQNDLAEGEASA